jgi:hypothetical protein
MKRLLVANAELGKRLDELEARITKRLGAQDGAIAAILRTLRQLAIGPSRRQRRIGFTAPLDDS